MRRLVLALGVAVTACTPESPGEWAAISPTSLAVASGSLYGFGSFQPKRGQRGANGVLVVDAEALFIRDEALAVPTRDLARAQVREWNTDPLFYVGGDVGGLLAMESGATSLRKVSLADPKHPVVVDGGVIDLEAPPSFFQPWSADETLVALANSTVALVRSSGDVSSGPLPGETCSPIERVGLDRAVVVVDCATTPTLAVLEVTPLIRTLDVAPLTQPRSPQGLGATSDGLVVVGDRNPMGPALHLYTLQPFSFAGSTSLALGDTPLRIVGAGTRVLVFTATDVLLMNPSIAVPLARLALPSPPSSVAKYESKAEPSGRFFALAHGDDGLSLLEVRDDALVHRGGFRHRWSDQAISLLGASKY